MTTNHRKDPWFKFWPSAWQSDEALRVCSLEARGLWLEMLCLMHKADPRGRLLINGKPVTEAQLAAVAGVDLQTVKRAFSELSEAGVFSVRKSGVVVSRRIEKEENLSRKRRESGKIGGSVTAMKNKAKPDLLEQTESKHPSSKKIEDRSKKKESNDSVDLIESTYRDLRSLWPPARRAQISKPAVLKALKSVLNGTDQHALIDAARRYTTHPDQRKDGGQYCAALLRWLKDELFKNWLPSDGAESAGSSPAQADLWSQDGPADDAPFRHGLTFGEMRLHAALADWKAWQGQDQVSRWLAKWGERYGAPPGSPESALTIELAKSAGWTIDHAGRIHSIR